ncbi:hypothetical protein HanRHA438_Chr17g0818581 [Helianthus annuus]|nr:hypothetical protein HanRHA438_Chr17g0818581 [Helianthus annuus]
MVKHLTISGMVSSKFIEIKVTFSKGNCDRITFNITYFGLLGRTRKYHQVTSERKKMLKSDG